MSEIPLFSSEHFSERSSFAVLCGLCSRGCYTAVRPFEVHIVLFYLGIWDTFLKFCVRKYMWMEFKLYEFWNAWYVFISAPHLIDYLDWHGLLDFWKHSLLCLLEPAVACKSGSVWFFLLWSHVFCFSPEILGSSLPVWNCH